MQQSPKDEEPGPQKNARPDPSIKPLQHLSREDFLYYLNNYSGYVRKSYKLCDDRRINTIPEEVKKQGCLIKSQVMKMDLWIRKRGALRNQKDHEEITKRIMENGSKNVERVSREAFNKYRPDMTPTGRCCINAERAWDAIEFMVRYLDGIGESMACLLLSVAFPETVPYCSEALFRWTQDAQSNTEFSSMNKEDYVRVFQTVDGIRETYIRDQVTAVNVENVAFVIQCNSDIEGFRDPKIAHKLRKKHHLISEGGCAEVYKVELGHSESNPTDKRVTAVKKIMFSHPKGQTSAERHRILTEILVSGRLAKKSPTQFVECYGWDEDREAKCYYIEMEYVKFGDLEKNLKDPGEPGWRWSEADMKHVAEQVLRGLDFMHKELIAHRDLKPQVT
ncbi:hypothetical protein E0Z10_g4882 [Xylaria hypoxylon]|uniref:non-specific serine/threonine protein kinase n=1 Tax=Xylaria hypoxylon TaxID=37992 RepID=A0A4Z0YZB3_9PEZI|nr:hypothetical protein E0Z10_g4882 [Xylaria hypoxylon]